MRGEFIRGLDSGRGVDNGRGLGSSQGDAIRNITGIVSTRGSGNMDGFFGLFTILERVMVELDKDQVLD